MGVDISGGILLGLAGLALVASTSAGTLFVPIWLLLGGQLAVGVALFAYSFKFGGKNSKGLGPGALRWRERATGTGGRIVALALVAALTEVATMLPYLAAVGILTSAHPHPLWLAALLAGYCVVMVVPALALLAARAAWSDRLPPLLTRIDRWIVTRGGTATGWILGAAGFLIARDAAARRWFAGLLS